MRAFNERGGWWVVGQMALLGALVAVLWAAGYDWGITGRVVGSILAGLGGVQAVAGLVTLGESLTPFPVPRGDSALVARGVYCLVRHPIYGGLVLAAAGVSVLDGNPIGLGFAVVLAAYFWAKSGFEERRLMARYPGYADYRSGVRRRLIPFVL